MEKKEYKAPMLEIMNCRVERGFAGSGDTPQSDPQLQDFDVDNSLNGSMFS